MTLFRYEAMDRAGKTVLGAMNAADEQQVAQRLSSMGYSLKAVHRPGGAAAQAPPSAKSQPAGASGAAATFPVSVEPTVSLGALSRFYRQLATMIRAGMPVAQALDDLSRATSNRKLRRACEEMRERAQRGEKLSGAMAAYPHYFPVHTTGMIWGGELGGYLDEALEEAATEIEQEAKDRRYASIGWWVVKMSLVAFIFAIPTFDLRGLLVSGLTEASKLAGGTGAGGEDLIPSGMTAQQILQGMAAGYWIAFKRACIPILLGWFVGAFVWRRLKRTPGVRRSLDAAILAVPAWGSLHRERALERFLRSLNRQYHSGVAPAQAWAAASMCVRNSELAARLRTLDGILRTPGGTLQHAFLQSRVFTQEDAGMIATGERSGSVPEMLEKLAGYHADVAAAAKSKGRMLSFHALLLPIIIATGYMLIRMVQGYFDFAFDAARLLGLE